MQPVGYLHKADVIQQLIGGVSAVVVRPREAQCPLVLLAIKDDMNELVASFDQSSMGVRGDDSTTCKISSVNSQGTDLALVRIDDKKETYSDCNRYEDESMQPRPADWARILEAATQRRTEVLTPENLENMWTKGRNYKKKESKHVKAGFQESIPKGSLTTNSVLMGEFWK